MAKISSGTMTVTVLAALVGLGGAFVVRQTLQRPVASEAAAPKPAPEMVTVPLAATDLQPGRKLTLNDLAPQRMTMEQFRKSEFRKLTFLSNTQQIQGRTLRKAVQAGRPFDPADFYADGAGPDIAERLQPGFRAVTVPIENVGAVNGFAAPGSMVDVLFRAKPEGGRPQVTLTLLERIEVIAFNVNVSAGNRNDFPNSANSSSTVTLAVTPQQAKILKVVEGRGEISLTLRNPKDDFQFAPVEVGMRPDLFKQTSGLKSTPDEVFQKVPKRNPSSDSTEDDSTPFKEESTSLRRNSAGEDVLAKVDKNDKNTDADRVDENINRLIGNASERLTLEDLLGVRPPPKRRTLQIYRAGSLQLVNFDDPTMTVNPDPRVTTPLAGTIPSQSSIAGTVRLDSTSIPPAPQR